MSSQQVAEEQMIEVSLKFEAMNYTFCTKWWPSTTISKQENVFKNIFKVGLSDIKLTYNGEELWHHIPLKNINPNLTPMDIFIEFDLDDSSEVEVFVPASQKPKSQPRPKSRFPQRRENTRFKVRQLRKEQIEFREECNKLRNKLNALPEDVKAEEHEFFINFFKL